MREKISVLLCSIFVFSTLALTNAAQAQNVKEWTFLVYLNGNNNLDSFGAMNINQMEKVGSSDQLNIVVQWASYSARKVKRVYVQKDNDLRNVTSPVVQDMGTVDMGDYRNLSEFIQWGAQNYPAKHYLVDVWDHGSGWHAIEAKMAANHGLNVNSVFHPTDISWDDFSGNSMTTKQLGQALSDASRAIGQKIDIYGSDACLMAMAEVAGEMKDSVSYFVGSQEVEPGAGWPYDQFLLRWVNGAHPRAVASMMVREYTKSYQGGTNGFQQVTMSAFDLSKLDLLEQAVADLGTNITGLDVSSRKKIAQAANRAQKFTNDDYGDLVDFVGLVEGSQIATLDRAVTSNVRSAVSQFVVANAVTPRYAKASGLSIWMPSYSYSYNSYAKSYAELNFQNSTHWSEALRSLF